MVRLTAQALSWPDLRPADPGADTTYVMVRTYVTVRRPQMRVEQVRTQVDAFVLQSHLPGLEAGIGANHLGFG
ncbi:hypothetical protein [Rhodococcus sp. NPDC058521]|uniref:hypothetical protein n=1 Tax=Rhodococcus sp. NPDC058521 TaxID=3346536 RepID=UPI003650EB4A